MSAKPRIRASELDSLIRCPGSRTLRAIVERRGGDDAKEGTALHWMIAQHLVREMKAVAPDLGDIATILPAYKLSDSVKWIVPWCVSQVEEHIPSFYALEVETELEHEFPRFVLTGHIDCAGTSPDGAIARDFDWKCGRIAVDAADENWQVRGYQVLRRKVYGITASQFRIAQPWNDDDFDERVSLSEISGAEALDALCDELEAAVNAALDRPMEVETGVSQCKYCVGQNCPAIREEIELMKMTLTPEALGTIRATPDDATLVDWVMRGRTLTKPIDDAAALLKERIEANGPIAYEGGTARLSEEPSGFDVVDPAGMYREMTAVLSPEQMGPALSYSGTKIKKALSEALKIPLGGKSAMNAKGFFEARFAAFLKAKTRKLLHFG